MAEPPGGWTFLSNHGHVLVCLAQDPDIRIRDVAEKVGITERAAFRIVTDLEEGGVVRRNREGRRNRYEIEVDVKLRHPIEQAQTVGHLLSVLLDKTQARRVGLAAGPKKRADF